MPTDAGSLLFVLAGFALTFFVARMLGAGWRKRRREREEAQAREAESRQVRRARERRRRGG
jgi:uncharacterized membrane protein YdjX (TVP38/TMEM64 family)